MWQWITMHPVWSILIGLFILAVLLVVGLILIGLWGCKAIIDEKSEPPAIDLKEEMRAFEKEYGLAD